MDGKQQRILMLVGSPKGLEKSNSARLGRRVADELERLGWTSEAIHAHQVVKTEAGTTELLAAVDRADALLFVSPLYVDSLPAPAIRALEAIAEHRRDLPVGPMPRFAAILNCGFVEPSHNDTCQRILRRFAEQARFDWMAGISLGVSGQTPKRIRTALEILVEAINLELLLSDQVEALTRKPLMPRWLYMLGGNAMWRRVAKKNGVRNRLRDRPYAPTGR